MITLRGHHLICLVAFGGQGYSAEFSRNFQKLQKIYLYKPKEKIKVITGPDHACHKCPHLVKNKCVSPTDGPNSKIIVLDKKALKMLRLQAGLHTIGDIHKRLKEVRKSSLVSFCKSCSWYPKTHCPVVIREWIVQKQ